MSIYAAIHARWAATASLIAVVPAARVTTGNRQDDDDSLPVATISLEGERKSFTNSGPKSVVASIRVQAWIREHVNGVALRSAMETAFDNTGWTSSGVTVVLSRVDNSYDLREPDGVWQFVFDLEIEFNATP